MSVEVDVPEARMGAVISDISSNRRGTVDRFDVHSAGFGTVDEDDDAWSSPSSSSRGELQATVLATVPLAELLGCVRVLCLPVFVVCAKE
jgi:translation elongation factor EF-G